MTSLTDPSLASPSRGVAKTCRDAWARLASVAEPNSRGGTTTFAYSYDGTGRLVGTTTTVAGPHGGGRVTAMAADNYYAGSQLIETDVSDGTVYQYVWSARAADPILRDTMAGATRVTPAPLLPVRRQRQRHGRDRYGRQRAGTVFLPLSVSTGSRQNFRLAAGRPSPGVGRSSLAHSSMAA